MTEAHTTHSNSRARRNDEGSKATLGLAEWLRLAAAPTFVVMALLTGLSGSPMDRLCSSGHMGPLSGMITMYLLMSAFHSPPWLNLAFAGPTPENHQVRDQPSPRRCRLWIGSAN